MTGMLSFSPSSGRSQPASFGKKGLAILATYPNDRLGLFTAFGSVQSLLYVTTKSTILLIQNMQANHVWKRTSGPLFLQQYKEIQSRWCERNQTGSHPSLAQYPRTGHGG